MKKILTTMMVMAAMQSWAGPMSDSDSLYVASYRAGNGLRVAYSVDMNHWTKIGENYNLLSSDYGPWGSEKKMASVPCVMRDNGGEWYAVWAVNSKVNQFATTHTKDLSCWVPQDYPYMTTKDENVVEPIVTKRGGEFVVMYKTSKGNTYETTSKDFIHWTDAKKISEDIYNKERARKTADLPTLGGGSINKATWAEIEALIAKGEASAFHAMRDNQSLSPTSGPTPALPFREGDAITTTISADLNNTKAISPNLLGIFFEDINYAADGGLYAELLQNRDFEYKPFERKEWTAKSYWKTTHPLPLRGGETEPADEYFTWNIATEDPIHENNPSYSVLEVKKVGGELINEGFDGIPVKANEKYDFSVFLRSMTGSQKVNVMLKDGDKVLAEKTISANKGAWKQVKTVLVPNADCANAVLAIEPMATGTLHIDFASLFPQKTFKGRKNGLRADLAQTLADMHPKFIRFPGGCASHGQGINNIYHWQATVGDLWARQGDRNIWNYHQSRGLGFYEYFQFCEDIGAAALPVLSAGVPCQNSWMGGNGQQGGIPWTAPNPDPSPARGKGVDTNSPYMYNGKPLTMESYLQELLDLIEWANGDPKTSKLAKMRADAGHPKPFGMKYLGIGNEDLISEVFLERYTWLIKEVKKVHPEITIVGTVGPFWEGSDYEYGWDVAHKENIDIVDEHYYNPIGWYLNHQDFYDKYPRTGTKVYLGEWASKGNKWENALAEAIHITNVERNADVVVMSSYAPLLARKGHTQWNPDLIYFDNNGVYPTPNYYIQMLAGQNAGSEYVFSDVKVSDQAAEKRVTSSIVKDENGDVIIKIVNALPVENTVTLNLENLNLDGAPVASTSKKAAKNSVIAPSITMTQMATNYDSRTVDAPKAVTISKEDLASLKLPKYSFTVIRVK